VIYFRVVDAGSTVIQVGNHLDATSRLAQTTPRWVPGEHDLDEMLAERDKLSADIQDVLEKQTEAWRIRVSNVEIKHIDPDASMVRAIARLAEGEQQATQRLLEAAGVLAPVP
jgi:regulator of protease activity HflC (stomatin/prohibitin superfamily)